VSVLPNPYPALPDLRPRDELRASFGLNGRTLAFAGRLSAQKSLDVALAALASVEGVTLAIAGDGDRREPLERRAAELGVADRVRFIGVQPRGRILELFRAADAALLSSSWENFPHTVVEALAVGTPVLATQVGGVAEIVHDGENGLLVPAGDGDALAGIIRRFFADDALRDRLRAAAADSVRAFDRKTVFGRLERVLQEAVRV
jgi:glycosyltransferase involved in cell wall biosynthesis